MLVISTHPNIYPTDQKVMIQGSQAAQAMCKKEFVVPLVKTLLSGKDEEVVKVNQAVEDAATTKKKNDLKRKKEPFPCHYCERSFSSVTAVKKHTLTNHIVALEEVKNLPEDISPTR